jgi:hypothetical protein
VAPIIDALDARGQRAVDLVQGREAMAPVAEPQVAHQDLHQPLDDGLVARLSGPRRHHAGGELRGKIRITGVQVRIVKMALEHPLLQAIGYRDVGHAAVVGVHAPVARQPVAALHVLGRPGEQQLAEAEPGDKDPGLADLAGLELDPLERIAGVVDLDALPGLELARRDRGGPVLRELAVELLPEVGVRDQVLGLLLPQELERMAQAEIVDDRRPVELPHPQRIGRDLRGRGRGPLAVPHFPHCAARAAQRPRGLAQPATLSQPPPDLLVPMHRHAPHRHVVRSFVDIHEGCGSGARKGGVDTTESHDRTAQQARGTAIAPPRTVIPGNQGEQTNLDIGGPLPCSGLMPGMAPTVVPNSRNRVVPNSRNQVVPNCRNRVGPIRRNPAAKPLGGNVP